MASVLPDNPKRKKNQPHHPAQFFLSFFSLLLRRHCILTVIDHPPDAFAFGNDPGNVLVGLEGGIDISLALFQFFNGLLDRISGIIGRYVGVGRSDGRRQDGGGNNGGGRKRMG